jgi:hypothetical protein
MTSFSRLLSEWEALQSLPVGTVIETADGKVMRKTQNDAPGNICRDRDYWKGELGSFSSETLMDYRPFYQRQERQPMTAAPHRRSQSPPKDHQTGG